MRSGDCVVLFFLKRCDICEVVKVVHGNRSDHCDRSDTLPSTPRITKSSARKRCAQFPIWNTCVCRHTHACTRMHAHTCMPARTHTKHNPHAYALSHYAVLLFLLLFCGGGGWGEQSTHFPI